MQMWDHLVCQPPLRPPWSFSCCLAASPLCPSCQCLLLLRVWVNVSSLTPWLSGFHTTGFSGSSGCFLFLNLLLSFFSLYKEAQCVCLHPHLGRKSCFIFFLMEKKNVCIFLYCCSSAVFCLSLQPSPPPKLSPPPLPVSTPDCYCPYVLYNCSCNPSTFSPIIPSLLSSDHCQPLLNFNVFGYALLSCSFC